MDSTNEEKKTEENLDAILRSRMTMEERFREIGAGSIRFIATRQEVIAFINQELQSLIADILGKKTQMLKAIGTAGFVDGVTIKDILQISKDRGIELK